MVYIHFVYIYIYVNLNMDMLFKANFSTFIFILSVCTFRKQSVCATMTYFYFKYSNHICIFFKGKH